MSATHYTDLHGSGSTAATTPSDRIQVVIMSATHYTDLHVSGSTAATTPSDRIQVVIMSATHYTDLHVSGSTAATTPSDRIEVVIMSATHYTDLRVSGSPTCTTPSDRIQVVIMFATKLQYYCIVYRSTYCIRPHPLPPSLCMITITLLKCRRESVKATTSEDIDAMANSHSYNRFQPMSSRQLKYQM